MTKVSALVCSDSMRRALQTKIVPQSIVEFDPIPEDASVVRQTAPVNTVSTIRVAERAEHATPVPNCASISASSLSAVKSAMLLWMRASLVETAAVCKHGVWHGLAHDGIGNCI